jgi:hypothetical protein
MENRRPPLPNPLDPKNQKTAVGRPPIQGKMKPSAFPFPQPENAPRPELQEEEHDPNLNPLRRREEPVPEPVYVEPELDEEGLTEEERIFLTKIYASTGDTDALDEQTFSELSLDPDWQVRNSVAMNPSTPTNILATLATDRDDMVRQTVMENPAISDGVYAMFAQDKDLNVILSFIENERTTAQNLEPLLSTQDPEIMLALSESPVVSLTFKAELKAYLDTLD